MYALECLHSTCLLRTGTSLDPYPQRALLEIKSATKLESQVTKEKFRYLTPFPLEEAPKLDIPLLISPLSMGRRGVDFVGNPL